MSLVSTSSTKGLTGSALTRLSLPAALAAALLICYAPVIRALIDQWSTDPDMGHGFFVPLGILWIVWRERSRWLHLPARPNPWGLALLGVGAGFHIASAAGLGLFAGAVGLLISILGAVLAIAGTAYMRVWRFPLLLTLFMLPKLAIVYNQLTLPLQLAASRLAAISLWTLRAPVILDGNILQLGGQTFSVDEACNGIRFLLSLGFLAVLYAYGFDRKPWMRSALLLMVIPLAIGANALRVAATVLLGSLNPVLSNGGLHTLCGVFIFAACLPALAAIRALFNFLYARLDT